MILITGASQGIGFACARLLLERTASPVLITGRSAERLAAARDAVPPDLRARLLTLVSDQSDRRSVDELCALIRSADLESAILNVGVNPAFTDAPRRLHAVSTELVETAVRTNCAHLLLLTQAVLQRCWERRAGVLVWVGSQAQAVGLPGAATYCATKAFLVGLARAARHEYSRRGIRVQLVHPGLVRTPRTAATVDRFAAAHGVAVHEAGDVAARIVERVLCPGDDRVEVTL
jgi:NAD(P)-dependent dehydrogenase (short-subunit alcohol dehydrogenase family)